jgi:hypothetical protein
MMGWWVVFGDVVAHVLGARAPVNLELFLIDSVFEPVESHVECFRAFLFDEGCEDSMGC